MKMTDYEKVATLAAEDLFLLDGSKGTRAILAKDLERDRVKLTTPQDLIGGLDIEKLTQGIAVNQEDMLLIGSKGGGLKYITASDFLYGLIDSHVNLKPTLYRGKNLGSVFTEEQKANIANGSFKGLFLGDYWTDGLGNSFYIADFNLFKGVGDPVKNDNHLVIVSNNSIGSKVTVMNDAQTTQGAYLESKMRTQTLPNDIVPLVHALFPEEYILSHREILVNSVVDGVPHGGVYTDCTIELLSEVMIFGNRTGSIVTDINTGYFSAVIPVQFSLFREYPAAISSINHNSWWTRDVSNDKSFVNVTTWGALGRNPANTNLTIRVYFCLAGAPQVTV